MAELKNKKIYWLRMIATALLVSAIVFGLFYLYTGKIAEIIETLNADLNSDKKTKYPNTIWLIDFVATAIPVLAAIIAMNIMYCDKKSYVPVYTQREKLVVSVALAVFIFGAMLAYVLYQSRGGEITDPETGEAVKTLWDRTYMWFFAQVLPMLILITYHSMRIGTEKRELLEAENAEAEASEDTSAEEPDEKGEAAKSEATE